MVVHANAGYLDSCFCVTAADCKALLSIQSDKVGGGSWLLAPGSWLFKQRVVCIRDEKWMLREGKMQIRSISTCEKVGEVRIGMGKHGSLRHSNLKRKLCPSCCPKEERQQLNMDFSFLLSNAPQSISNPSINHRCTQDAGLPSLQSNHFLIPVPLFRKAQTQSA